MDLCEFKASLVYVESSRTVRAIKKDLVSRKKIKDLHFAIGDGELIWLEQEVSALQERHICR